MEAKIIQEFKGILNNVLIENEKLYYCIEYILSKIEDKFGECFNKKFVEDLKITTFILKTLKERLILMLIVLKD